MQTTSVYPRMRAAVSRWLTRAARTDGADAMRARFELAEREAGDLSPRHLTLAEQADVLLGFHAAQALGRPQ
jgi:hypothetical protein